MDLRLTCGRIDTAVCVKGYRVGFLYGIGISALGTSIDDTSVTLGRGKGMCLGLRISYHTVTLGAVRVILMLRSVVLLKLGGKRVSLVLCLGIVTVVTVLISEVLSCGIILPRRIRVWAVGCSSRGYSTASATNSLPITSGNIGLRGS